ncbi:YdcF family protein [Streptococcus caprae]|uniref:YdcF family protein n=1 Tax=Streptococcus caprae TaxID=1640501 RepID=A0ABV8CSU2_9STRE
MKPIIPKTPEVPELSTEEIAFLTEVTFGKAIPPKSCDALFIFSGTHPGHWEKAIEAYQRGLVKRIIVTGGRSLTGTPHEDWNLENPSEAAVIIKHLIDAGVPEDIIVSEYKSTNTLENVLFAKEVFDFTSIQSLLFICKSHATGRQWRTLAKHLPDHLSYVAYTFDAVYQGTPLSRDTWMNTDIGRSRVWGEYLRIIHYGKKGDILALDLGEEEDIL